MMSSLEKTVKSILEENHIPFVQEKRFDDLYNGLYRFDFFLPNDNIAFEIQGL